MEHILDIDGSIEKEVKYAGFWIRVASYFIDAVVVGVVNWIIILIVIGGSLMSMSQDPTFIMQNLGMLLSAYGLILVLNILYFVLMESSKNQGTLGKMAVGIKVTDANGQRISIGRALGRYLSKIISALILLIGFIMVGFDAKKRGLHDMIAGTFVVYK